MHEILYLPCLSHPSHPHRHLRFPGLSLPMHLGADRDAVILLDRVTVRYFNGVAHYHQERHWNPDTWPWLSSKSAKDFLCGGLHGAGTPPLILLKVI